MFLAVCFTFLIFGNVKSVSVADASAILYKNGTKVQSYATMDEAFNAMTDSTAKYSVNLKGQHVVARTSWPKVKSITIDGGENSAQLILPEGTTTLNSNGTGTVDIKSDCQMLGTFHMKSYYMHYIASGKKEGRAGTGCKTLQGAVTVYNGVDYSAVFDYNYYISNNGDIKAAFGDDDVAVLAHFVNYGMSESRRKNC